MEIKIVDTPELQQAFLEMPLKIYKDDPNYIRPLDKDIDEVFDPAKNKAFRNGEVIRFIAYKDGITAGRIAAFVNKKYKNKGDDLPVGGIGFFDVINDREVSFALLDKAKAWLDAHGMEAMDGPINFGERDRWWGMVCEGYSEPLYCMNYNPPYYNEFFEAYGFKPFFYQLCFSTRPKDDMADKIWSRHEIFDKDPEFHSESADKKNLEKYARDFVKVYNAAWAGHGGLKQMAEKQAIAMFKSMKPVMDPRILFFVYHKNDPIAIFINLPDLNQWFRHLNGKFTLYHKLKFLWLKATKPNKKFTGLVFGVVPEWQGKGIDAYMIGEAHKYVGSERSPYTEYEMQWVGDFNPKMVNVAMGLGDVFISRKLVTYRYLFDRTKEFHRHPIIS